MKNSTAPLSIPAFPYRAVLLALGGVLLWFLLCEGATQAWYAWKESQHTVTQPWEIHWPTEKDAAERGFLDFQPRTMTDAERELLRFTSGQAASWRSANGGQWTGFYLQWKPDFALNQMDLMHNPIACLPAAGLQLVRELQPFEFRVKEQALYFKGWEFEVSGRPVFAYVATRFPRNFTLFDYLSGEWEKRFGNIWKAMTGNRGNPLQTIELVGVGFPSEAQARSGLEAELNMLLDWAVTSHIP